MLNAIIKKKNVTVNKRSFHGTNISCMPPKQESVKKISRTLAKISDKFAAPKQSQASASLDSQVIHHQVASEAVLTSKPKASEVVLTSKPRASEVVLTSKPKTSSEEEEPRSSTYFELQEYNKSIADKKPSRLALDNLHSERDNQLAASTPIAPGERLSPRSARNFLSLEETEKTVAIPTIPVTIPTIPVTIPMIPGQLNRREALFQVEIAKNDVLTTLGNNSLLHLQYPIGSSVNTCMLDLELSAYYPCVDFSIIRYNYILNHDNFVSTVIGSLPKESLGQEMWLLSLDYLIINHPNYVSSLKLPDDGGFLLDHWKVRTGYHFFQEKSILSLLQPVNEGVIRSLKYEHRDLLKSTELALSKISPDNREFLPEHAMNEVLNKGIVAEDFVPICVVVLSIFGYFFK
jgi:hypothetical protein